MNHLMEVSSAAFDFRLGTLVRLVADASEPPRPWQVVVQRASWLNGDCGPVEGYAIRSVQVDSRTGTEVMIEEEVGVAEIAPYSADPPIRPEPEPVNGGA